MLLLFGADQPLVGLSWILGMHWSEHLQDAGWTCAGAVLSSSLAVHPPPAPVMECQDSSLVCLHRCVQPTKPCTPHFDSLCIGSSQSCASLHVSLQKQPCICCICKETCKGVHDWLDLKCTAHSAKFEQVVACAGSGVASFALDPEGCVWAWGTSKRGQLGLGQGCQTAAVPTRVPGLHGVTQMACGWGHMLAVTGKALNIEWPDLQAPKFFLRASQS